MEAKISLDGTRWRLEDTGPDGVSRRQVSHVSIYLGLELTELSQREWCTSDVLAKWG